MPHARKPSTWKSRLADSLRKRGYVSMAGTDATCGLAAPLQPSTPDTPLVFVRHPKARRYIIRVVADGTVRVTVPRWGSKRRRRASPSANSAWIERERRRVQVDNLAGSSRSSAARQTPRPWRARDKKLPARLLELAAHHGLTVSRVSIRNQQWRWGSCSPSGHICLNWRLVEMPPSVRDYVMHPRADAPQADGSLAAVLEARRGGVSRLSNRARVAQDLSPRLNTRPISMPNSGSSRRPRM